MNLDREVILAAVEEDNVQRAYFRVHPLLTVNGPCKKEASELWPDEGCLRIVPDRAEQFAFKDRMRHLNGWCIVNLSVFAPEANKIRTNKNYHPERGESNQYILYSDAVQSLPDCLFYELIDGEPQNVRELAEKAMTPKFYIRQNDTLYGPVLKDDPSQPNPAGEMQLMLYEITGLDGNTKSLLCSTDELQPYVTNLQSKLRPVLRSQQEPTPQKAENAVPVLPTVEVPKPTQKKTSPVPVLSLDSDKKEEKQPESTAADEKIKVGEKLQILNEQQTFEETLQDLNQPVSEGSNLLKNNAITPDVPAMEHPDNTPTRLNGTPLVRSQLHTSVAQPKNKLQEVVYNQCHVSRNEPPAASLPTGTVMREVSNPVQEAIHVLRKTWETSENRSQLVDFVASMEGMLAKLEPRVRRELGSNSLKNAIHAQLQDLEAERLTLLVELDKARSEMDGYRHTVLHETTGKEAAQLTRLQKEKENVIAGLEKIRADVNQLTAMREELVSSIQKLRKESKSEALAKLFADTVMAAPVVEAPIRMAPVCGAVPEPEQLLERVVKECEAEKLNDDKNRIIAMLVLLAVCSRIGVVTDAPAAAITLINNMSKRLGWSDGVSIQTEREQLPVYIPAPANGTPAILITLLGNYAVLPNIHKVMIGRTIQVQTGSAAYAACQWPVVSLKGLQSKLALNEKSASPVAESALMRLAEKQQIPLDSVQNVLRPILALVPALGGNALREMCSFVSTASGYMDGGLVSACDWAVLLWVIPALPRIPAQLEKARQLLIEYPMSMEALG